MNREQYHQLRRERFALGKEAAYHRSLAPGARLSSAARIGGYIDDINRLLIRQGPGAEGWRIMLARWASRRTMVERKIIDRKRAAYWDDFGRRCRALRDQRDAERAAAAPTA